MGTVSLSDIFADEKRVAVLGAMRNRDMTAHEIAAYMGLPASAASYQIKQMVLAGLLRGTRSDEDARVVYYRRESQQIRSYLRTIQQLLEAPDTRQVSNSGTEVVLYICRANSARSQIAAAWSRMMFPSHVNILSAGVAVRPIHPLTIVVMAEVGIDLEDSSTTALDAIRTIPTAVVSVCDSTRKTNSKLFQDAARYHWSTPDPAVRNDLQEFRRIRDDLRGRVEEFVTRW